MPENLKRIPSGYQFRKVVPKPLRGIIGKSEFKVPCGKVYAEALARYHIESVKAQQALNDVRPKLLEADEALSVARGRYFEPDTNLQPISAVTPELVEQLRGFWLSGLEYDFAVRAQGIDDDEYEETGQNITDMQAALGRAMARGQLEVVLPSLHQMLFLRGYVLALRPEEERRLAYDFLGAVMEGYEVLKSRHEGVRTANPVINSVLPEFQPGIREDDKKNADGLTVGKVIQEFLDGYAKKTERKSHAQKASGGAATAWRDGGDEVAGREAATGSY